MSGADSPVPIAGGSEIRADGSDFSVTQELDSQLEAAGVFTADLAADDVPEEDSREWDHVQEGRDWYEETDAQQ